MKLIKKRFLALPVSILIFITVAASGLFAQTARPVASCPIIRVSCPDTVSAGQPLTFSANVSGGDPGVTPKFNWSISAGKISSGQGTSSITVDTTGLDDQTVTATVDVNGYARECNSSDSCTASVSKKVETRKFDEYGKLKPADENARLDNFAIALKNDASLVGYIITYGGRQSSPNEAQKTADTIGEYLTQTRGLINGKVFIGVGGYREDPTVELWIAEPGATPPMGTPTLDPSEVKPAKTAKPTKNSKPSTKAKTLGKTKKP